MKKKKPDLSTVEAIIKDKDGNIIGFNLASTAANDDWIRAARITKKERNEMEETNMYTFNDEEK